MGEFSPWHLLIVAAVFVLLFSAKKLPDAARSLGRSARILKSELHAVTGYNTYEEPGLPKGPITNPSKASIEAVLHPAKTDYLYFVADGTGGHVFATTLAEQEANKAKWFAIRRARGQM